MIKLVVQHAATYPHLPARERLEQVGLTEMAYWRLRNRCEMQTVRESAIPDPDVTEAVKFFIKHPDVGAAKARATLLGEEKAWISAANLNRIKHVLVSASAEEYKTRKEARKLLEAQFREDLAARKKATYKHMKARYPHHIWAIDFLNITFQGMPFVLCVVYDEYSQEYPAIKVGFGGDHHLATSTLAEALAQTPTKPVWMRRDNGKAFLTELFQKELEAVKDYPVPPHSPWYNGALESCNGSLKAAVKTIGMQKMACNSAIFRQVRLNENLALEALGDLVSEVRTMLNKDIARLRHGMTPAQVISGKEEVRAKQDAFVSRKRDERKKRMATIRANPERKSKTLLAKTQTIVKRAIRNLETDVLYVLNEVLHHRFRMFET